MLVREILRAKPFRLVTIAESASLQKASELISAERVGMLLVTAAGGQPVGMLSERDLIYFLAKHGLGAITQSVDRAMVDIKVTAAPTSSVSDLMRIMTAQRARHLPVLDGDMLVGVISIGDILNSRIAEKNQEAAVLRDLARRSLVLAA